MTITFFVRPELPICHLLPVPLGHKAGGSGSSETRGVLLHVILGIAFLLPFQHSLTRESWWYFRLLLLCASQQQNCALSKITSVKVCFDYFLILLPSLFITNLGKESEHLKDVYIGDYAMLKDVCFRIAQQLGCFCFSLTSVKRKNTELISC